MKILIYLILNNIRKILFLHTLITIFVINRTEVFLHTDVLSFLKTADKKNILVKNFNSAEYQREHKRIIENFKNTETEGLKNILMYFGKIHDKLFTFNNILIAGFFLHSLKLKIQFQ